VHFFRDNAYHVRRKIQDPLPNLGISQAYMITTITIAKKPYPKGLVLSSNLDILKTEAYMIRAVTMILYVLPGLERVILVILGEETK
jgi:hypothetical protein